MDSLFADEDLEAPPAIEGLSIAPGWIDAAAEAALIAAVDAGDWSTQLRRRVQHHGWRYDYEARAVTADMYLGPLPARAAPLARRLAADGAFERPPDQLIVNEYEPGQGIAQHVDCEPCFGEVIASLTLGSGARMTFDRADAADRAGSRCSAWLAPRSLLVMRGPARHAWRHGIPARQTDVVGGVRRPRARRLSLTFRTVRQPA